MRKRAAFMKDATLSGWQWLIDVSNHVALAALLLLIAFGISIISALKLPHWWYGLLILGGFYVVLFGEGAFRVWEAAEKRGVAVAVPAFTRSQQVLAIKALAATAIAQMNGFATADEATEWFVKTTLWIRAGLGDGLAGRFADLDYHNVYPTHAKEWLDDLIDRVDAMVILETFDPADWQDYYS